MVVKTKWISRFNDTFSQACGCSPREYRKVHVLA